MIHKETKWPIVWATRYNNLLEQFNKSERTVSSKRGEIRDLEERNTSLKSTILTEQRKRDEAVENEKEANKRADKQTQISDKHYHELQAVKKKLSDNAIPTRDQKSGRFKKRA